LCFHGGCELTTPNPSALIIGVKFCDQDTTGTNLHTQERTKDLNAPLIAISPFCHVLVGAICHVLVGAICHVLVGAVCHVLAHTPF
jgi:hypothetical protein